MMKFYVHEVYTPDDTDGDRRRKDVELESESTDIVELTHEALKALGWKNPSAVVSEEDVCGDNDDYDPAMWSNEYLFVVMVFSNNGEYEVTVSNSP